MIGARFYTQLDASQMRNDVIEEDLAKVYEMCYICVEKPIKTKFLMDLALNRKRVRVCLGSVLLISDW